VVHRVKVPAGDIAPARSTEGGSGGDEWTEIPSGKRSRSAGSARLWVVTWVNT